MDELELDDDAATHAARICAANHIMLEMGPDFSKAVAFDRETAARLCTGFGVTPSDAVRDLVRWLEMDDNARKGGLTNCSECMQVLALADLRILPWWNETCESFVTTARCAACWAKAIGETEARLRNATAETRDEFCGFFARYGATAQVADLLDRTPSDAAGPMLHLLAQIDSGAIVLGWSVRIISEEAIELTERLLRIRTRPASA